MLIYVIFFKFSVVTGATDGIGKEYARTVSLKSKPLMGDRDLNKINQIWGQFCKKFLDEKKLNLKL